jgi:hypothetical protein
LRLLKSCLAKLVGQLTLWIKTLPAAFEAVSGPYMFHLIDTSTLYNYIVVPIIVYTHSFGKEKIEYEPTRNTQTLSYIEINFRG